MLLDAGVCAALGKAVDRLRPEAHGVVWVAAENIHITLKFLGSVDAARLDSLRAALDRAVVEASSFDLGIAGIGAFPAPTRPRVIWAGVAEGRERLGEVAERVERELVAAGFAPEERAFSPHVTLGRVREPRRDAGLEAAIRATAGDAFGRCRIDRVSLMRSDLSSRGARYTELSPHALG